MKTFVFYSYDANGNDVEIEIEAVDRERAFAEFDFLYGEDTPLDCCVEKSQVYSG